MQQQVSVLRTLKNLSKLQALQSKMHALLCCCMQARKVLRTHNLWHSSRLNWSALRVRH